VTINVQHAIEVLVPGNAPRTLEFTGPKALTLSSGDHITHLDCTLRGTLDNLLPAPLSIEELSFTRIEKRDTTTGTAVIAAPTVLGGDIRIGYSR
jgi:hypothetical protein